MINSFKDRETEKIYNRLYSRKLPHDMQRIAVKKLWMIDAAPDIDSLRVPPGNKLEALKGDQAGQFSIRINDQWRIRFKWSDNNAYNVEIVDYH
jgi:toxin HigB-1